MQTKGFLGIDVSKGYADFLLLDEHKQQMETGFQLQDNDAKQSSVESIN